MAEAQKYIQGRLKSVPKKFRNAGNTDEEVKKMQLKERRSVKKELKSQQAQAQALNMNYLIDHLKLQTPPAPTFSISGTGNSITETENDNSSENEVRLNYRYLRISQQILTAIIMKGNCTTETQES